MLWVDNAKVHDKDAFRIRKAAANTMNKQAVADSWQGQAGAYELFTLQKAWYEKLHKGSALAGLFAMS